MGGTTFAARSALRHSQFGIVSLADQAAVNKQFTRVGLRNAVFETI